MQVAYYRMSVDGRGREEQPSAERKFKPNPLPPSRAGMEDLIGDSLTFGVILIRFSGHLVSASV